MPRMASGSEMGNTQMEKKSITTDAAMYPVMSALSPFHASIASGRSGFAPRAGNPYALSMGIATAVGTAPAGATRATGGGPSGKRLRARDFGGNALGDVRRRRADGRGVRVVRRVASLVEPRVAGRSHGERRPRARCSTGQRATVKVHVGEQPTDAPAARGAGGARIWDASDCDESDVETFEFEASAFPRTLRPVARGRCAARTRRPREMPR
jgi:hypothetical protein